MLNDALIENQYKPGRSSEEAARCGRLGGVASGKARREKKALRNALLAALSVTYEDGSDKAQELQAVGLEPTVAQDVACALIRKALTGDSAAFVALRDSVGEKPVASVEVGRPDEITNDTVKELSDEELRAMIAEADDT